MPPAIWALTAAVEQGSKRAPAVLSFVVFPVEYSLSRQTRRLACHFAAIHPRAICTSILFTSCRQRIAESKELISLGLHQAYISLPADDVTASGDSLKICAPLTGALKSDVLDASARWTRVLSLNRVAEHGSHYRCPIKNIDLNHHIRTMTMQTNAGYQWL